MTKEPNCRHLRLLARQCARKPCKIARYLTAKNKEHGKDAPCSFRFICGFNVNCLIRLLYIPTNYWRGLNPAAAAQGGAAAVPAGLPRITPDWSEQKARWPDWPSATGTAPDSNVTNGLAVVPAP